MRNVTSSRADLCFTVLIGLLWAARSVAQPWPGAADSTALGAEAARLAELQAPVPLAECPADLDLLERHRTVLQTLGGTVHRWREYTLEEGGATCIVQLEPHIRALETREAALLLAASAAASQTATDGAARNEIVEARPVPRATTLAPSTRVSPTEPRTPQRSLESQVASRRRAPASIRKPLARVSRDLSERRSATALPGPLPPDSLVFGSDDRQRVADTTLPPWSAVVYVESTFPTGSIFGMSGVLAGPYTVLTSALAIYNPDAGGWAESVQVFPGQNQASEGANIIEPFGSQFAEFIEVPQSWIDDGDVGSLYGAVLLPERFDGIPNSLPVVFDAEPDDLVNLAGYDQMAQGESNSFAQWHRSGTLDAIDSVFFDHRMDDDGGALGAPAWEFFEQSSTRRVFGLECCNAVDLGANSGIRFTSENEGLITDWVLYEPDDNGGGDPLDPIPLLLGGGRFEVTVLWRDPQGERGVGAPVPLTADTGYFWFFRPDNVELVVKVLDACSQAQPRYWVFAAGLTNVEVDMEIVDTDTGARWDYFHARGQPFPPVQDTNAFSTCP